MPFFSSVSKAPWGIGDWHWCFVVGDSESIKAWVSALDVVQTIMGCGTEPGVIIHFHDIWYPFEYPHDWLLKGMFWNEAYLLRAFLMFNTAFEILFLNSYVSHVLAERIKKRFPLFMEESGASTWLRRV